MSSWSTSKDEKGNPTFTTSGGLELRLRGIPPLVFRRFTNPLNRRRPQAPMQEIRKAGKMVYVPNFNNQLYVFEFALWSEEIDFETAEFILGYVDVDIPEDFESDNEDRKYDYIAENIPDVKEVDALIEAVKALTMPTKEGLVESEENFPDDSNEGGKS